jgi:trehalose 6-phosphate phosphatase
VSTNSRQSLVAPLPPTARATAPPARLPLGRYALFLDLDGTLVDFAPRPEAVRAEATLLALLHALGNRSGGALALVSGRSIASLDAVTAPERFCASGLHGFERRDGSGLVQQHRAPPAASLEAIRERMQSWVSEHPSLFLEDKGVALALHYRGAPELGDFVEGALGALPDLAAQGLRIQHGHMVAEVVPASVNKGSALAEFMREPPFRDRLPLYLGDDLTDEPAFHWVNLAGGTSVVVNPRRPSAASAALPGVTAVHAWLGGLLET